MGVEKVWADRLDRQWADVQRAAESVEEARREDWKVLPAQVRLQSVQRAYAQVLEDAPWYVVSEHLIRMAKQ